MPDFLLCNSKLTFQLTMTPEKTNYMTQGADGAKRLKQGPDISSYRGLSVIHSRAFSLEVGREPRDILRRRVRTAEYYRILPHKDNLRREFELYTEERDTWFTLTFQDLMRYAMHGGSQIHHHEYLDHHDGGGGVEGGYGGPELLGTRMPYGLDNHQRLQSAYKEVIKAMPLGGKDENGYLGAPPASAAFDERELSLDELESLRKMERKVGQAMKKRHPLLLLSLSGIYEGSSSGEPVVDGKDQLSSGEWQFLYRSFDFGIRHLAPSRVNNPAWGKWYAIIDALTRGLNDNLRPDQGMVHNPRLTAKMQEDLFLNLQGIPLNHPFKRGVRAAPLTSDWYTAFTFYQEVYRRFGVALDYIVSMTAREFSRAVTESARRSYGRTNGLDMQRAVAGFFLSMPGAPLEEIPTRGVDITAQFLAPLGVPGAVNHQLHFLFYNTTHPRVVSSVTGNNSPYKIGARNFLLVYEFLEPLMKEYALDSGLVVTGMEYLQRHVTWNGLSQTCRDAFVRMCTSFLSVAESGLINNTLRGFDDMLAILGETLGALTSAPSGANGIAALCTHGINTWPMTVTTLSHPLHPQNPHVNDTNRDQLLGLAEASMGCMNKACLLLMKDDSVLGPSSFLYRNTRGIPVGGSLPAQDTSNGKSNGWVFFWNTVRDRIFQAPLDGAAGPIVGANPEFEVPEDMLAFRPLELIHIDFVEEFVTRTPVNSPDHVIEVAPASALRQASIDLNGLYRGEERVKPLLKPAKKPDLVENVEIVIIRPNIEHNMLGIIMGLAGSELGYTMWGQTELSCYDDSMHGIWGMSYKYHERAIVFNERNLVRLWDIAYDGYNGGKDDTYVDWMDVDNPKNGLKAFQSATLDLSRSYRGPSMMVMAFVHDRDELGKEDGRTLFESNFRRNWPSPIVFHDTHNPVRAAAPANETLPLDYDNIQVLDVEDFRVFNNPLYAHSYGAYRDLMPPFHELHVMRKSAGQSSADAETHIDSLAFQGSMRIKEKGRVIQEIQGSGHHGPDYVGVASVRAGKGIKYTGQAPALTHMV